MNGKALVRAKKSVYKFREVGGIGQSYAEKALGEFKVWDVKLTQRNSCFVRTTSHFQCITAFVSFCTPTKSLSFT